MDFLLFSSLPILIYAGCVVATGFVARAKGRAVGKWVVFALLFAPLALIIVVIMDDYVHPRERYRVPVESREE